MTQPANSGPRHARAGARGSARPSARSASRRLAPRQQAARSKNAHTATSSSGVRVQHPTRSAEDVESLRRKGKARPFGNGRLARHQSTRRSVGAVGPTGAGGGKKPAMAPKNGGAISLRRPSRLGGAAESNPWPLTVVILVCAGILLAAVLLLLSRCAALADSQSLPVVEPGQNVEVAIAQGAGGDTIAKSLLDAGVIADEKSFMQAVSSKSADQKLKPGTYLFTTGMDPQAVVERLMAGPNTQTGKVVVPEGLTVARTAEVVQEALGIPTEEFLAQAKASNYVNDYDFLRQAADDSLEGFLWAKTYDFSGRDITADAVIRAMLDQYAQEAPTFDFAAGETENQKVYGVSLSDYDVLKLASIIEREAISAADLPLVSSVFWNRLRDGMPLQSDATMGYVTGGEVSAEDLKTESPYNTYLTNELPPTPICTPDKDAIEAALHPTQSDYLYFLIIEQDGYSNHTFSTTYEDHVAAIEAAQDQMAQSEAQ